MDTDIEATATSIGALVKASVRGEVSPERIRDKLPSNVGAYEVIEFRMCTSYANGLYSPEEYRAFIDAKSGLLPAKESRRSPLKEGVSADSVRQNLIQFIEEANPLLRELDKAPTNVSEESKRNVVEWVVKVRTYLEGNFTDPTYVLRFKNFAGLPPPGVPFSVHSYNDEYLQIRASVMNRLVRLHQFLDTIHE